MGEGEGNQLEPPKIKRNKLKPLDYVGIQTFVDTGVILDAYYASHPHLEKKRSAAQRTNAGRWWRRVKDCLSAEELLLIEPGLTIVDALSVLADALGAEEMYVGKDGEVHTNPDHRVRLQAFDRLMKLHGVAALDGRGQADGGGNTVIQVALIRGEENGNNGSKPGDEAILVRDTKAGVRSETGRPGAVLRRGKRGG